ncbi:hypothetical protein F2Q69_00020166 [Brassica cretica]|uniref:Reverse transcriptase zinc-binding domain-containing protein n=1 Tax=Brassica cretica TaxID=69181 RepID=A0A8S9QMT8_BRACR|nr:hypothetical protein F2Q69_00020166 [Brassica cretica]
MRAWGQVQGYILCGEPNETRDHLFFSCPYTFMLWIEVVGSLLGRPPDPDLESTLDHLAPHSFGYLNYILLRNRDLEVLCKAGAKKHDRSISSDPPRLYADDDALMLRQHCLGIPSAQFFICNLISTSNLQCNKNRFVMNSPSNVQCRVWRMEMTTSVSFTPDPINSGLESHLY